MTQRVSHKEQTRARILDEAARALREHGTQGVGVATLMKRVGLTHGGFYAHFGSRDDLVAHAVARMFDDNSALLSRHLDENEAAIGLAALIDAYLSPERLEWVDRGCPFPPLLGEARRMPAAARAHFIGGIAAFRDKLSYTLKALGRDDPEQEASSVLSELIGAATIARAMGSGDAAASALRTSGRMLKRRLGLQFEA